MTTATFDARIIPNREATPKASAQPPRRPLSRRIWDALEEAGRRRAEREIAAYIAIRGGRVTDSLERSIERYCETRGLR